MDKNSIQEYGWIVVIIILLALIIAFARPFGLFIANSISDVIGKLDIPVGGSGGGFGGSSSLKEPENLNIKEGILTFDPVDGATGYTFKIGDEESFDVESTIVVNEGKASIDISDKLVGVEGSVVVVVNGFRDDEVGPAAEYTYYVPGLYETGSNYTKQLMSWKDLISAGIIHVDNGVVYSSFGLNGLIAPMVEGPSFPTNPSSEYLKGDLLLPHDGSITAIGDASVDMESAAITGNVAFGYCEYLTGIKIPDSVLSIGDGAFLDCTSLTSIELPESVAHLGQFAFSGCYSLQSAQLSNNIEEIGKCTFTGCSNLTNITLPQKLRVIGEQAFIECYELQSISFPESLERIESKAFSGCGAIGKITLSKNVEFIGEQAFSGGYNLKEIIVSPENPRYKVINKCLIDTETKTLMIALDGCSIPTSDILYIAPYSCHMRTDLTSVVLPDGLLTIGDRAFVASTNLESITIPNSVTFIGEYAFYNCPKLESIVIPEKVTVIGSYTFRMCANLKSITLPAGITEIGGSAFLECSGLTDIYFEGTAEQWNDITKKYNWDRDTGEYTVHCSDETLSK